MKKLKNYKILEVYIKCGVADEMKTWHEVELKDLETGESHYIEGYESVRSGKFYITDYDCAPEFLNEFEHVDELNRGQTIKFVEVI